MKNPGSMRINRYLAHCGIASRRSAEKLVLEGRVKVNGVVVQSLGCQIDERQDQVTVDDHPVQCEGKNIYILLNKPKGYVTTAKDEHGRKTVMELVKIDDRLVPVGRLDYQSEGLLLLTNDGDLTFRLLHPRFKVSKIYYATLKSDFNPRDFQRLTRGVQVEDYVTQPCEAWFYGRTPDRIAVCLQEGKKHQVRLMLAALGYEVKNLRRVQFGPLTLGRLRAGEWRRLTSNEVHALKKAVGLSD
ncbi:rRNA pseudouridine synthase [bacterium]|nr:rRNA pseudouridine synthase [bacterium]